MNRIRNEKTVETKVTKQQNKCILLLISYHVMIYRRAVCGANQLLVRRYRVFPTMRGHMVRVATGLANEERPHRATVSGLLTCSAGSMIVTSHAGAKYAGGGFSRKRERSDVANVLLLRSPPPTSPPPAPTPRRFENPSCHNKYTRIPPPVLTIKRIFFNTNGN